MHHAASGDGTSIAFHQAGDGTAVVIVGGAFSTAEAGTPLAAALAEAGLREESVLVGAMILSFVGYLSTAVFLHGDYERFLWLGAALLLSTGAASHLSLTASAPVSARAPGHVIRS